MKKVIKISIVIIIILIILICCTIVAKNKEIELIEISSQKELEEIYEGKEKSSLTFSNLLTMPFSMLSNHSVYNNNYYYSDTIKNSTTQGSFSDPQSWTSSSTLDAITSSTSQGSSKEYSTTNIQVENVDEADITKTDGDYIYSLSEDKVVITNVKDPTQIKIASTIEADDSFTVPEDLLLYNDKLVVISQRNESTTSNYYSYNRNNTTVVSIYDISSKEKPKEVKNYELEQPYYTSRCIDGKLYVISSGNLKEENGNIITYYKEDGKQVDPGFRGIKRMKDLETTSLTVLSMLDLNKLEDSVRVNSYLMDVENAYISESNIYLLDEKYKGYSNGTPPISSIFGVKGILGAFDYEEEDEIDTGTYTQIYKFNLQDDGSIQYDKKVEEKGETINQFSVDEYEGDLRIALYNGEGSRIVIFDNNMKKIGETEKLAEGEKMYSSRFLGNKAYLVTYKTVDPLFVIDLSNPESPKTLGKLKIPGYSTYLHPYDENHIIGIGMQTEEKVNRNSSGKITSTSTVITGMKMALFDVTDVENPIQISDTIIGNSRTTSAILTNHKALLFSKEKQLLAIPVNNYSEDFEITNSSDTYSSMINSYTSYSKEYISEGYFVYHINLEDGFKLKGTITHKKQKSKYSYSNNSRLLRGLYIEDNLYTISEDYIKVNQLEDLQEISQLKIKED
ncbi:MAG: beta-propeller domain-containing protein [Clostridia bacterium]